jgi:hypothetical protein
MTIRAKGIDERHPGCRIEADGGNSPMASRIHEPNGKSRLISQPYDTRRVNLRRVSCVFGASSARTIPEEVYP